MCVCVCVCICIEIFLFLIGSFPLSFVPVKSRSFCTWIFLLCLLCFSLYFTLRPIVSILLDLIVSWSPMGHSSTMWFRSSSLHVLQIEHISSFCIVCFVSFPDTYTRLADNLTISRVTVLITVSGILYFKHFSSSSRLCASSILYIASCMEYFPLFFYFSLFHHFYHVLLYS